MTPDGIISVLAYASLLLGGCVVSLLIWFAVRIVNQLDAVTQMLATQHNDFKEEMHKHDIRIAKLELEGLTKQDRRDSNS